MPPDGRTACARPAAPSASRVEALVDASNRFIAVHGAFGNAFSTL